MCAAEGGVTQKLQQNVAAVSMGEVGMFGPKREGGRKPFNLNWKVTMGQPAINDQTKFTLSCVQRQKACVLVDVIVVLCQNHFLIISLGISYSLQRSK